MSLSSEKFSSLTNEFPAERETVSRLAQLVGTGKRRELPLDALVVRLEPKSDVDLTRILERLVFDGTIARVYRVENASYAPIDDFPDYRRIPPHIFDPNTGTDMVVTPRNVRVVFVLK
jgi:hypothetical protein